MCRSIASICLVADVGTPNFPPFIPFGNNQVFGARVDVWGPEDGRYFAPASTSSLPSPGTPDVLQGEFGGTSASAPFITGLIADAMALNPQFNRNTSTNIANIAPELRRLLTATSWPSGRGTLPADSRRELSKSYWIFKVSGFWHREARYLIFLLQFMATTGM